MATVSWKFSETSILDTSGAKVQSQPRSSPHRGNGGSRAQWRTLRVMRTWHHWHHDAQGGNFAHILATFRWVSLTLGIRPHSLRRPVERQCPGVLSAGCSALVLNRDSATTLFPKQAVANQEPLQLNETWEHHSAHLKDHLSVTYMFLLSEARKQEDGD